MRVSLVAPLMITPRRDVGSGANRPDGAVSCIPETSQGLRTSRRPAPASDQACSRGHPVTVKPTEPSRGGKRTTCAGASAPDSGLVVTPGSNSIALIRERPKNSTTTCPSTTGRDPSAGMNGTRVRETRPSGSEVQVMLTGWASSVQTTIQSMLACRTGTDGTSTAADPMRHATTVSTSNMTTRMKAKARLRFAMDKAGHPILRRSSASGYRSSTRTAPTSVRSLELLGCLCQQRAPERRCSARGGQPRSS